MIPAQLWEAMCCQVTGWEGGRKWDMGVWGAFTIADDTGDLTRPMGCSYLTSARWLPTLGGHEGHAVVSGLCCALLCCAVARGRLLSPHHPPARAQAAGSVCWRLCTFQFVGHSPSKPLQGQRQLGAVTNNPRAPVTPAPDAACQLWGGGARETAPCSPGVLEGSSGVVLGGPSKSNQEGGTRRAGFLAGGGSDHFLGSSGERRRNAVVTSALGTGVWSGALAVGHHP